MHSTVNSKHFCVCVHAFVCVNTVHIRVRLCVSACVYIHKNYIYFIKNIFFLLLSVLFECFVMNVVLSLPVEVLIKCTSHDPVKT